MNQSTATPIGVPAITQAKLDLLDEFLVNWNTEDGWPASAPFTASERQIISEEFFKEEKITWLRVLSTVLYLADEKQPLTTMVLRHFAAFPDDLERMFAYWVRSDRLADYARALLQTYFTAKANAFYPSLTGVIPFAETVMVNEGFTKSVNQVPQHTQFFKKYAGNAGVKTAEVFTSRLYQIGKRGELGNRELYNRHALLHGVSPDAMRQLDFLSGCLTVDMVVSTAETRGNLFQRVLQ